MIYAFGLAAIALAWLLPGHYYPWAGFQQETMAAIGAALVGLAALVSAREWPARAPLLAAVALAVALVPLLQRAFGMVYFGSDALLGALYMVAFAMSMVAARQLAAVPGSAFVPLLFAAFACGAIASMGLGLYQWLDIGSHLFIEPISAGDRISSNLRQPNHFASVLGLGLAAVWWAYETRRIGALGAALGAAFFGFGLVSTQSRAGWLMLLSLVLLWLIVRRRAALRTPPWAVALAVGLFALGVLAWRPLNEALLLNAGGGGLHTRMQSGWRLIHWQVLWDAIWLQPWLGYGWGQVALAQQAAVMDHPSTGEWLISAHNLILDLLAWNGVPIGAALIAVMAAWAVSRLKRCAEADTWALLGGLSVLLAHSMVEFPMHYAYFLLPAGLMIGAIEARVASAVPAARWHIGRPAFAGALAVMAGVLSWIAVEHLEIEEAVRRVRLRDAGYMQPGAPPVPPTAMLLDQPREYLTMWINPELRGMMPDELDRLRQVALREASPAALFRYAVTAARHGRPDDAQRTLGLRCHIWGDDHCADGRRAWIQRGEREPWIRAVSYPHNPSDSDGRIPM